MARATNIHREEVHYHRIEVAIEDAPVVEHWQGFSHRGKRVRVIRASVQWNHNCWPSGVRITGRVLKKDGTVAVNQYVDGTFLLPNPDGKGQTGTWRDLGEAPAWLARLMYEEGAPIALSLVRGWDPSLREPEGGAS